MAKEGSSRYSGADRKMEIAVDSKIVVKQFVESLLGSARSKMPFLAIVLHSAGIALRAFCGAISHDRPQIGRSLP
jgi:hypothetical protein